MVMTNSDLDYKINQLKECRKALEDQLMVDSMNPNMSEMQYKDRENVVQEDLIEINYEIYILKEEKKRANKEKTMSTILTIGAAIGAVAIATFLAIKLVHFIEDLL